MSSLNTAVVLTLITGFGGALAGGIVFNAPWWAWFLLGGAGLVVGLVGAIIQNQLSKKFFDKKNDEGKVPFSCMAGQLILPFLAVVLVTGVTVFGSILLTRAIWPDKAANPKSLGRLETGF